MRAGDEIDQTETGETMNDNETVTTLKALKLATPKRGTITIILSAQCRICGGRIHEHDELGWVHVASGDKAC